MTDKTKRGIILTIGGLVCVALVIAIAGRMGGNSAPTPVTDNNASAEKQGVVVKVAVPTSKPVVVAPIDTSKPEPASPAAGADSNGTEQTIQAEPTKPTEPPAPPQAQEGHDADDVPEEEKNAPAPPTSTPATQPETSSQPQQPTGGGTPGVLPGFDSYVQGGENNMIQDENMYENGNKIGEMG
jgi:type IV secretory pathway VirB10-like protein